ncbi:MAG: TIR domain-containing protein [Erythrobacter sp.]|nr:TIR domain-containing protein [Erythrobacter sp.]
MSEADGTTAGGQGETTVFVSYSRADQPQAAKVIELLEAAGFAVWWDATLTPGTRYVEKTEAALESARAVVVLWTQTSIASNWVRDEAQSARDRHLLVPVSLDGSMAPLGFRQFQAIDFSRWKGDSADPVAQHLLAAVSELHGREGKPPPPLIVRQQRGLSRRALMLGGGGVAAALALGGWAAWRWGPFAPETATNSIAVLPFRNLSGNAEEDYFSAGLAEELRVTLSLNPQLQVAGEASSRLFEESAEGLDAVADRLGVAWVLEGTVRRSAELLRITARLVDVATGFEAWSQVFERDPDETLELQGELATSVVDELFAANREGVAITRRPGGTSSSTALDHYLHGLAMFRQSTSEATDREALTQFEAAIAADPDYALGHATYGWALSIVGASYSSGAELADYQRRAQEEARRAIALAPDAPEGHAALGLLLLNSLDLRGAAEPYRTSFDLGFGNAQILAAYAQFSVYVSDFAAAQQAVARAQRLDPLNPQVFRTASVVQFFARDFAAARAAAEQALALSPQVITVHSVLGDMALVEGDLAAARAFYEAEPSPIEHLRGLAIAEHALGQAEAGQARFDELLAGYGDSTHYQQGQVLAQWGETDRALAALEQGLALRDAGLAFAGVDPLLDPIRQEPRFAAILARLGLDEGGATG